MSRNPMKSSREEKFIKMDNNSKRGILTLILLILASGEKFARS